jgi:nuclear protein 1
MPKPHVLFCYPTGKQRTKKEAEQHTNFHNPAGHERKIMNKLMNAEKNAREKTSTAK